MYIQKLNDDEILTISTSLLSIVEQDQDTIRHRIANSQIKKYQNCIVVAFDTRYETHELHFNDFDASITYGAYNTPEKVSRTYRKLMYGKFGETYKENFEKFYKAPIIKRYESDLRELSDKVDDMINKN